MKYIVIIFELIASIIHAPSIQPRHEDSKIFITKYLSSLKIDTVNSYVLSCDYRKDSISLPKFAINTHKLSDSINASPLQIRMYSNNGKLVGGWEQCFGSFRYFQLLDSVPLKRVNYLPVNWELKLKNDLKMINCTSLQRKKLLAQSRSSDYTIIVFWASWTGWYSKDVLKKVRKYIKKNEDYKFLFIQLNTSVECNTEYKYNCKE